MDVGEIWKGADMTFVKIMVTYWSLHGGGGGGSSPKRCVHGCQIYVEWCYDDHNDLGSNSLKYVKSQLHLNPIPSLAPNPTPNL